MAAFPRQCGHTCVSYGLVFRPGVHSRWSQHKGCALVRRSQSSSTNFHRNLGDLAKRPRLKRSCTGTLPRGLVPRSCQKSSLESFYRDLIKRFCQETLAGSFIEILSRGLLYCQETSFRDLVGRPGEENRNLTLRSLAGIFCGGILRR